MNMIRALQRHEDTEPMSREQNHYLREKTRLGLFGKPIQVTRAK